MMEEELSMPRIADYTVIQDGSVTLPKANGDIDHDFPNFSATAVDTGSRSILAFRVNPTGTATLQVTLNGTDILTQTFDTEPQRSWHEVVESNLLLASNNTLTVTRSAGPGSISVSDLFITYQANI
jgi:hypothetical protein